MEFLNTCLILSGGNWRKDWNDALLSWNLCNQYSRGIHLRVGADPSLVDYGPLDVYRKRVPGQGYDHPRREGDSCLC